MNFQCPIKHIDFNNGKSRMLADIFIHKLSSNMKIAVRKNHLMG